MLAGEAEPPEAFCRRHGIDDPEFLATLEELHRAGTPRERFGEFVILRRLGAGGMGVVYLARQPSLERDVALKIVRAEYADSETAAARLEREALAIASLRHPHIVGIHAVGEEGGQHYIAMEYVEGEGLDERLRREVQPTTAVQWASDLADALQAAHDAGIVHRDVKPSNIRITPDGRPLLLDFGVARRLDRSGATLTESYVGSPHYMAPEQIAKAGGDVDQRTDVYSLGAVLYECLASVPPFEADSLEAIFHQILTEEPRRLRSIRPELPRDLEVVVHMALEKDPSRRYATASAMRDDLRAILEYRPIDARRPGLLERARRRAKRHPALVATAVTLLIALVVAMATWRVLRAREASHLVREASTLGAAYRESIEALASDEQRLVTLEREREARYFSDAEDRDLERLRDDIVALRLERQRTFHRALDHLRHAERLGVSTTRTDPVRAALYLARYIEAATIHDAVRMQLYRGIVRDLDEGGTLEPELVGDGVIRIESDPPGASVYAMPIRLQREVVEGGDRRLVPTSPLPGDWPFEPGAWMLRVVRPAGEITRDDLVESIEGVPIEGAVFDRRDGNVKPVIAIGGVTVRDLYDARRLSGDLTYADGSTAPRGGAVLVDAMEASTVEGARATIVRASGREPERLEVTLPAGLVTRPTARPVLCTEATLLGETPMDLRTDSGDVMIVVRKAGYEAARFVQRSTRERGAPIRATLLQEGTTPVGWVAVPEESEDGSHYWIREHEVTMGAYLEFLNDPEVRTRINASAWPILYPRGPGEAFCARRPDGTFAVADGTTPEFPVLGVSWHDAAAYVDWLNAREDGWRYALPSSDEWVRAAGIWGRFVFGDDLHPKWCSSCFARPAPSPEPVMQFPIDESFLGVYDMTGSACEWTTSTYGTSVEHRWMKGGSWGLAGPLDQFAVWGGNGYLPDVVSGIFGFRVVRRPAD